MTAMYHTLPGQTSDCGSIRYVFCIEVQKAAKNHTRIHVITTEYEEPRETPAFSLVAQGPQNRLEYALK